MWECTHLGGHRFSGTLLSLPDGTCLGGLDAGGAADVVRALRDGAVPVEHLRGVTALSPAAQAAQAWLLREHGPAPLAAATVVAVAELGGGSARVELHGTHGLPRRTVVTVDRDELAPAPLSCGASPGEHAAYVVRPD